MNQPDPADFPARLAAGDPNVEQDIFRAYTKEMNKAALAVFKSKDRSVRGKSYEDAVNEARLEVHRKQLLNANTKNIPGLLVQTVTRRALEMVRTRKTDAVAGAEALETVEGSGAADIERAATKIAATQVYVASIDIVATMKENERKVFHLLYRVGMTPPEAAEHLGMTERGVRGINKRIITHIKKQLGSDESGEGGGR